jgi:hypothetical protein
VRAVAAQNHEGIQSMDGSFTVRRHVPDARGLSLDLRAFWGHAGCGTFAISSPSAEQVGPTLNVSKLSHSLGPRLKTAAATGNHKSLEVATLFPTDRRRTLSSAGNALTVCRTVNTLVPRRCAHRWRSTSAFGVIRPRTYRDVEPCRLSLIFGTPL